MHSQSQLSQLVGYHEADLPWIRVGANGAREASW